MSTSSSSSEPVGPHKRHSLAWCRHEWEHNPCVLTPLSVRDGTVWTRRGGSVFAAPDHLLGEYLRCREMWPVRFLVLLRDPVAKVTYLEVVDEDPLLKLGPVAKALNLKHGERGEHREGNTEGSSETSPRPPSSPRPPRSDRKLKGGLDP